MADAHTTARIDDLALISDLETAALVDRTGSVVWACLPRFDSGSCFAALLDGEEGGFWRIAPNAPGAEISRRYTCGLVLESTWKADSGIVRVIDFMPVRDERPDMVRIVEGVEGEVEMGVELVLRFDYGSIIPWVRRIDGDLVAVAGPDRVRLHSPVKTRGEDMRTRGEFTVRAGERVPFVFDWHPSHAELTPVIDADNALERTEAFWRDWQGASGYSGKYADDVHASLAVLKGLVYDPTGGIIASPTTSLPETPGGNRNWDYRYCWLRDATYTLLAFLESGHVNEAVAWRDWLLRAVAGEPGKIQIMYGVAGERRLPEYELDWLAGYQGASPVRIGNDAHNQHQLDVFGEVMDALHQARAAGMDAGGDAWMLQQLLIDVVADRWREPDDGMWEIRGPSQHFTHSKVMAWVAVDRAIKAIEEYGLDGPIDDWRSLRDEIKDTVLERAVDERGVFTQAFDSPHLDANLLLIPLVGFLPFDDERVVATVDAIVDELMVEGYLLRYQTDSGVDGLSGDEGAFLLCSFWLAQVWAMQGRSDDATELFERLLALRNDVGLLAEEVDPRDGTLLGNMPQAFSHLAIVNTAMALHDTGDGIRHRAER